MVARQPAKLLTSQKIFLANTALFVFNNFFVSFVVSKRKFFDAFCRYGAVPEISTPPNKLYIQFFVKTFGAFPLLSVQKRSDFKTRHVSVGDFG